MRSLGYSRRKTCPANSLNETSSTGAKGSGDGDCRDDVYMIRADPVPLVRREPRIGVSNEFPFCLCLLFGAERETVGDFIRTHEGPLVMIQRKQAAAVVETLNPRGMTSLLV